MTLTLTGLLILLLIAAACGALGRAIAGDSRGGLVVSIAVGFVGALLGSFIAGALGMPDLLVVAVDEHGFPILWSIIGAASFVAFIHLVSGSGRRWRFR
jgi:uncharacterized membrane protein YeaQ/YmgE (transglycosylase-associated protein family)